MQSQPLDTVVDMRVLMTYMKTHTHTESVTDRTTFRRENVSTSCGNFNNLFLYFECVISVGRIHFIPLATCILGLYWAQTKQGH